MNMKYFLKINHDVKTYIFLFLVAIFMLGVNPFKAETIAPMDLLQNYSGWKNTNIEISHIHPERSDILDSKLPHWIEAKRNIYKGHLPEWNHVTAGGYPQLFMFTRSLCTPAFVVFTVIQDNAIAFYFSNLINVLIGLIGMYLFLRIFFNQSASTLGAITFMFSGFNAAWFFWPHVNTAIWAPWVLWSVYKYLTTGKRSYLPLVTLTMVMLNLGGFPMVAVMTYMALALLVIIFLFVNNISIVKSIITILYLATFFSIAIAITLPFIYPLTEMLSWIGGIGYRQGGTSFRLSDFQLFINPNLYDFPRVEKTFYVGVLPIVFLGLSVYFYQKKPRLIAKYGLILFLFSITIAFSLIHPDIIRMIPTLNSNPWSRFGFLIGISLAIITAYVFNELIQRFEKKLWIYLIIIGVFGVQIADQKKLFHHFNASVPNSSFFPQTKTISYLQEHIKPFQYVIADNGYFVAGTLGAYGLNEWYSHSFHTTDEKKILTQIIDKPFKTPTAAMFRCSQIRLNSPYIDHLNIKSILCTSSLDTEITLWDNIKRKQQPAPTLPANNLVQNFHIDKKIQIDGVKLLMATYGKKYASSDVKLVLQKDHATIAHAVVDKKMITDNSWVSFKFIEPISLSKGNYAISVKMLNTKNAQPLTIWSNAGEKSNRLEVNGKKVNLSLKMVLSQKTTLPKKYKSIELEPNIHLIENTNVKGSSYFIDSLENKRPNNYDHIKTKTLSNTAIQIEHTSTEQGWIILPIRSYPGWTASINGKDVKIEKFLGMLPAVPVAGECEILFEYAPSNSVYLNLISVLGLLFLFFSTYQFRKERLYETNNTNPLL